MELTLEEAELLEGKAGPILQKAMRSVIMYGEAFGADKLVTIDGSPHLVTSFGANMIGPYFRMIDELIAAGVRLPAFTVNPRPMDKANVPASLIEKALFRLIYSKQRSYERQLAHIGLRDPDAFTCACYLPEVGNTPKRGAILAWSESSAVVYANSVLGARSNRNSAGIDVLCNALGKAPLFGLLTDEGRRARWLVRLETKQLPNPQVLGGAIGMRVVEDVPYIVGLDRFLGSELDTSASDYLKDMGAAAASNGAVGLYHVEGLTPEAKDVGRELLLPGHYVYAVDDTELERVVSNYPVLWKNVHARPRLCFIGCPHLSLRQLEAWAETLLQELGRAGRKQLAVPTVLCAPVQAIAAFRSRSPIADRLLQASARLTAICPLMYMNNPLCARKAVVTNSNKLRTYSTARFYNDEQIARICATGELP